MPEISLLDYRSEYIWQALAWPTMVYLPKNYRSHSASSSALSISINFNSIVEWAIRVCLKYFQDTVGPPRVKTYPLVDFNLSESAIQLASMYPSGTGEYFLYFKAYSLI